MTIFFFAVCPRPDTDCQTGDGFDYGGEIAHTKAGVECLPWNSPKIKNPGPVENSFGSYKFCRNPDKTEGGAWCYTMRTIDGELKRWEFCDIPKCENTQCNGNF